MNINSLMDWVRYKKLEWSDHVGIMPETRLPRQVWEWILSERG